MLLAWPGTGWDLMYVCVCGGGGRDAENVNKKTGETRQRTRAKPGEA